MKFKILTTIIVAIIILIGVNYNTIDIIFIKIFKVTKVVGHKNLLGELEGEAIAYKQGRMESKAILINGKRQGWAYLYYNNGRIKNKAYYINDMENGPDSQFYSSGRLNYSGYRKFGKQYGAVNWYLENGQYDSYAVFNIKGESFCLFQYDTSKNPIKMDGYIISPIVYSMNKDSSIILDYGKSYKNIKDLYITVATPPNTKQKILIYVNHLIFSNPVINNNTIKISNLFKNSGSYDISIKCTLTDNTNKKIGGINLKENVLIE